MPITPGYPTDRTAQTSSPEQTSTAQNGTAQNGTAAQTSSPAQASTEQNGAAQASSPAQNGAEQASTGMIDLRSDTVTRPCAEMRQAMVAAAVGDDVWGDDPTVNELERYTAELLGKAAAVYLPSGTQSNLCAMLAHCERGDEYITGDHSHTFMYEGGGAAVLGSIQPQTVPTLASGMLDLAVAEEAVKPADNHFARTRLLCLENTINGKVLSLDDMSAGRDFADSHGLGYHLDGARLWNAALALASKPAQVAEPFDTVSVCLSKGLGAPVGSVLVGSRDLIAKARRWRKVLGGGMRQAGIIAAAGIYALQHNIDRLATDHENARLLADGLDKINGVSVTSCDTNMVFAQLAEPDDALGKRLEARGILADWRNARARMVLHMDVSQTDVHTFLAALAEEL